MPFHAPLSSRDGRVRSSSIHSSNHGQREPYYYTNEDIELLDEIVSLGQDLLPTLPKRDQLPTTALFRAADIVFPRYGISPDGEDKFSRVIFLVGGMRTTDDLYERFRTVLARMGIEIEYVDGESNAPAPAPAPSQVQAAATATATATTTAELHASPPPASQDRPRRHSDSTTAEYGQKQLQQLQQPQQQSPNDYRQQQNHNYQPPYQHGRRRSGSLPRPRGHVTFADELPQLRRQEKEEELLLLQTQTQTQTPTQMPSKAVAARPIGPWLSRVPSFPEGNADLESVDDEDDREGRDGRDSRDGDNEEEDGTDDGTEDRTEDETEDGADKVDQYTRSLEMLGLPATRHEYKHEYGNKHEHEHESELAHNSKQSDYRLPVRLRNEPASPPSGPSSQATAAEELPGASDTLIQEELDAGPPAKVDVHIMARVADTFFLRFAFLGGQAVQKWHVASMHNAEQEQYAVQIDRELSLSEAAIVWSEQIREEEEEGEEEERRVEDEILVEAPVEVEVEVEVESEVETEDRDEEDDEEDDDDDDNDDEETAQVLEYRDKMLKLAGRAYDIALVHKAFTHWQAMAAEEAERTQVARRHVLRQKVFVGWRAQTQRDEAAVRALVLGWAVQRWRAAAAESWERGGAAEAVHERDLTAVGLWTLLRARQERAAESLRRRMWQQELQRAALEQWRSCCVGLVAAEAAAETAAQWAQMRLLCAAVDHWAEQAQTQAAIRRRIEAEEDDTFARAALQDLQKQARLARELRRMQAARAADLRAAAVAVWRRQTQQAALVAIGQDRLQLRGCALLWARETRLAQFRADADHDLKVEALHSWVLAEKLAFLERYRDARLARRAFVAMGRVAGVRGVAGADVAGAGVAGAGVAGAGVAGAAVAGDDEHSNSPDANTADRMRRTNLLRMACGLAAQRQEQHAQEAAGADAWARYSRAVTALTTLGSAAAASAARDAELAAMAQRGAYYVAVADALDGWAAHARRTREARLRATYRSFRLGVKRRTAAASVRTWRRAAALLMGPLGDLSQTADALCEAEAARTRVAALNSWIRATNDSLFCRVVAADADAESYLSRWRLRLAAHADVADAAAEHHTVSVLMARWDLWELQAVLQAGARHHTATALLEKNDRRLLRRVVAVWQQAVEEVEEVGNEFGRNEFGRNEFGRNEFGRNEFGRNEFGENDDENENEDENDETVRELLPSGRWSFANTATTATTPSSSAWRLGSSLRSSTAASSFLLHPITEADLRSSSQMAAQTPIPQRPRHRLLQQLRPTPGLTPAPRPAPTPATAPAAIARSSGPASARLRRRLLSAARLADSVQLGPVSAFDEEEEEEEEEEEKEEEEDHADADVSSEADGDHHQHHHHHQLLQAGTSSPAPVRHRLSRSYASTVRTPAIANNNHGRSSNTTITTTKPRPRYSAMAMSATTTTTTPMGPLPSPFERRLRAAYRSSWTGGGSGSGGGGGGSTLMTAATPLPSRRAGGVTFAEDYGGMDEDD